jgi:transcriptional regulator with XRE-family HTH domain
MYIEPDILMRFGQRVRQLRKKRGLNQSQLAEITGLHKNYIGMVERGERNPSLINISKIAKGLDVSIHILLHFEVVNIPSKAQE